MTGDEVTQESHIKTNFSFCRDFYIFFCTFAATGTFSGRELLKRVIAYYNYGNPTGRYALP
jgi:hypothetical protein